MKSILISIKPKYCELIANGKKTVEVRKTKPKLDVPFKCYIYCTQGDALAYPCLNNPKFDIHRTGNGTINGRKMTEKEREQSDHTYANGKVIGEFICDNINTIEFWNGCVTQCGNAMPQYMAQDNTCLTMEEIKDYIGEGKDGYLWHISNLVIYDEPKELFEFANYNRYQVCKEKNCFSDDCWICPNNALVIRPPQNYMLVEKLGV